MPEIETITQPFIQKAIQLPFYFDRFFRDVVVLQAAMFEMAGEHFDLVGIMIDALGQCGFCYGFLIIIKIIGKKDRGSEFCTFENSHMQGQAPW